MKVWLDAGHTPRFVFPNGPEEIRSTWFKIADHHKDLWPRFMDEEDKERGKPGIVEAKEIALHTRSSLTSASTRSRSAVPLPETGRPRRSERFWARSLSLRSGCVKS